MESTNDSSEKIEDRQCQLHFFTKEALKSQLPTFPLSVPESADSEKFNSLLNQLLSDGSESWQETAFDFLIDGELLRTSLGAYLTSKNASFEHQVEVECILSQPSPEPGNSIPHEDWVSACLGSPTCIISGCYDNSINVFDKTGTKLFTVPGHNGAVKSLAWIDSSDCNNLRFVSGGMDQIVLFWKINISSKTVECLQQGRGHERTVDGLSCSSDGTRLASVGFDTYLKIWNTDPNVVDTNDVDDAGSSSKRVRQNEEAVVVTKTPMVTLQGHKEATTGVRWTDTAEVVTSSWDHTLRTWDLELAGQKQQWVSTKAFTSVDHSRLNGLVVTGSTDRFARLWDLRSKEGSLVKQTFSGHSGWISSVTWSKNNSNVFATASYDSYVKLWDIRSPNVSLFDLTGHNEKVLCVNWDDSEKILSGGADNLLNIFYFK